MVKSNSVNSPNCHHIKCCSVYETSTQLQICASIANFMVITIPCYLRKVTDKIQTYARTVSRASLNINEQYWRLSEINN